MKLTRLRIVGFKTFVEPTDVPIEPGLTGVVGPNGCGKSNLVEALRWVMGEASHKSLRASGMDDVIFSGSGGRPARNHAEVMLAVDNQGRTAPAAFNEAETLEISRRIERESGSTYRVNGREVRARDVQILFADAATGSRSPAMVRQGQIAELIAAKPQARRRVLEDAAGIAGLHARRHEAELRLKAAEDNLVRVEDVLGAIDAQAEGLRRQARGAGRYRTLSAEIRKLEALLLLVAHTEARAEAAEAERAVDAALAAVAERQDAQARAATAQAVAAAAIPTLREAEATAAADFQRATLALAALEGEERRAKARIAELARHLADLERDAARAASAREDAAASLARLAAETDEAEEPPEDRRALEARAEAAETRLAEAEAALAVAQAAGAEAAARRTALDRGLAEARQRAARLGAERARLDADAARLPAPVDLPPLRDALAVAQAVAGEAEAEAAAARAELAAAREAEAAARRPLAELEAAAARIETEARTLAKLFAAPPGARFAPVIDAVTARPGTEAALAAALGDDLDASTDPGAPARWVETDAAGDPALPEGARPLSDLVAAPAPLGRRLAQVGLVAREDGAVLRARLRPGQRLVSAEGDLWRWDGLTLAAEAPSAAARRLAERNRLGALNDEARIARERASARRAEFASIEARAREAAASEAARLDSARRSRAALDAARGALAQAERRAGESAERRAALSASLGRVEADEGESRRLVAQAEAALASAPEAGAFEGALREARAAAAAARAEAAEARAALLAAEREAEARRRRAAARVDEQARWRERAAEAERGEAEIAARLDRARSEQARLAEAPDTFLVQRRRLTSLVAEAEVARRTASDRLAAGETALAEGDRAARAALESLGAARETRAGAQASYEARVRRVAEVARAVAESLEVEPAELFGLAGIAPGAPLRPTAEVEPRLASLRVERERLGGVNLRADEELAEVETRRGGLAAERDDLAEAIRRLRGAIGSLNREGRERLLAALGVVDAHFRRLFTTLFGGGTAELTLVDSDDPLEAGLEIVARPPGKKPQTMTLLSGGEQALTATALIFAVFLTNPSPVCVLDEVDAPLDDANVERFCDLLVEMARDTETRFLVITHNPITMARMDRLFGVTMAERGVSQLVSVDLAVAERLREAS